MINLLVHCNNPNSPRADIVLFGLSLKVLVYLERFSHSCKKCFVLLYDQCGISQSTLIECPTSSLAMWDLTIHLHWMPNVLAGTSPGGRFSHPYKECFVLSSNQCGISQSTLLEGPASLLSLCIVSNSGTIWNSPKPKLTDNKYCLFGFSWASPQGFKTCLLGRNFHTLLKECFVLLSNQCRISHTQDDQMLCTC